MKQIDKKYGRSFLVETTKLTRLIDKIHERLGDHPHTTTHDAFEVFLSDKRHERLTRIDEVLALENSRKHRIQRLIISCSAATKGAVRPEHEIQVDFGKIKKTSQSVSKIIEISVRSEVAGWADRALSEVEEQVERTWLRYAVPVGALIVLVVCVSLVLLAQVGVISLRNEPEPRTEMWLRGADLNYIEQVVSQNRTITDEEMREIVTRQLRNVLEDQRPKQVTRKTPIRQKLLLAVPLLLLFGCAITLFWCYPGAVFLWGDEVGRYDAILYKRKTIWNIIIGVMVIGVVANLFSTSLLSFF